MQPRCFDKHLSVTLSVRPSIYARTRLSNASYDSNFWQYSYDLWEISLTFGEDSNSMLSSAEAVRP